MSWIQEGGVRRHAHRASWSVCVHGYCQFHTSARPQSSDPAAARVRVESAVKTLSQAGQSSQASELRSHYRGPSHSAEHPSEAVGGCGAQDDNMGRPAEALLHPLQLTDWESVNKASTSGRSYSLRLFPRQVAAGEAWCGLCLPVLTVWGHPFLTRKTRWETWQTLVPCCLDFFQPPELLFSPTPIFFPYKVPRLRYFATATQSTLR